VSGATAVSAADPPALDGALAASGSGVTGCGWLGPGGLETGAGALSHADAPATVITNEAASWTRRREGMNGLYDAARPTD
jgi:hypothetical protein